MRRFAITAAAGMLVGAAPLARTAAPAAHAAPGDCSKLQGLLQAGPGGVTEGPGWLAQCNALQNTPAPDQNAAPNPPDNSNNDNGPECLRSSVSGQPNRVVLVGCFNDKNPYGIGGPYGHEDQQPGDSKPPVLTPGQPAPAPTGPSSPWLPPGDPIYSVPGYQN
jgi:hypothetical protein